MEVIKKLLDIEENIVFWLKTKLLLECNVAHRFASLGFSVLANLLPLPTNTAEQM